MAWTTPRTWATSELVTAALLNTHLRDNFNYLYGGKESFYVPAAAMHPATTNGCAPLAALETTAGRPDLHYLAFDASAVEYAQFALNMPYKWNLSTLTFQVSWSTSATDTDGVAWALQAVAVSAGESVDVAYGSAVVVTDDPQAAAYDHLITAESNALTIAGNPADDDLVYFQILREVEDANDTMTEDALLLGLKIFYTSDQHFEA